MARKRKGILNTGGINHHLDVLNRHLDILKVLQENQPIGIGKLAERTNHSQFLVRTSLMALTESDIVKPTHNGTITTDATVDTIAKLKIELENINRRIEKIIREISFY